MMRSLFSGVAGLKTHQTKMDVIGNNIANVNTVAFKSSATTFSDIMYQTTSQASGATGNRGGVNAKQIGLGVTNGATKVSITSSGAAQSTGDALDIRLTDSNSTNFFIVSNGSENLFTRAGSFYIDGNGNLAMTTTGYLVMGWQVDPQNPNAVIKNTVTPLRVMQPANLTSAPEATTEANFSGVIDKYDTSFSSAKGFIRSFTIYDNLGYSYTAKFSIKLQDEVTGKYSVELTGVYDNNNVNLLDDYISGGGSIQDIFGQESLDADYVASEELTLKDGWRLVQNTTDEYLFEKNGAQPYYKYNPQTHRVECTDTTVTTTYSLAEVCGVEDDNAVVSFANGSEANKVLVTYAAPILQFDTEKGNLLHAGANGLKAITLHTSLLGPNKSDTDPQLGTDVNQALSDINIDFSQLLNYDNGGTNTAVANRGMALEPSRGTGKKLGTMTGLSISNNGEIFGSYSNGNTVLLGQIPVAQFANASGLEEMGDNCYKTTLNSGDFDGIGLDISADGSSMNTGQLEMSNVDLSAEFTDMITTQRGFQANSRIITVSDTMLEELINLKR